MQVTIAPQGALAQSLEPRTVTLPDGACLEDLLHACGLDPRGYLAVVSGAVVMRRSPLVDRSRVQLYPAQAGG